LIQDYLGHRDPRHTVHLPAGRRFQLRSRSDPVETESPSKTSTRPASRTGFLGPAGSGSIIPTSREPRSALDETATRFVAPARVVDQSLETASRAAIVVSRGAMATDPTFAEGSDLGASGLFPALPPCDRLRHDVLAWAATRCIASTCVG
jgi:hypothetical protein